MHFTNPFTNPPRLPSPSKRRPHSRSPSHSPVRHGARDNDPLLRDLSPSSTLRAFVSDPTEWTESTSNALVRSILTSTHSERALGAKAAQVCLDVRSWTREMEHWQWPGTFEVPVRARRKTRTSTLSFGTIASIIPDDEEEEYWGSLPAKTVQAYGLRADEIGQALDRIDVEELKNFVLSSHYRTGSRSTERGGRSNLKQLDDYTAVITATILQALPYLSRLNRLLDLWTIRLIVLQGATAFVRDLQRARMDMDHGWAAIAVSSASGNISTSANFSRGTMLEMKELIERQVGSLGRRLDRFLDDLEGREETVPDAWIEDFEQLETAYGDWVVQAERKVLENEWRDIQERTTMTRTDGPDLARSPQQDGHDVSHIENPDSDGEAIVRSSLDRPEHSAQLSHAIADEELDPWRRNSNAMDSNDVGTEWQTDNLLPRKSLSDERKSRNVPVASTNGSSTAPIIGRSRSQGNHPMSNDLTDPAPLPRSKTAFLNNVDRTNTLMKQSKTPVRSFEHASNAFTRLFKKDKSPEQLKSTTAKPGSDNDDVSLHKEDRTTVRGRKPFSAALNVARRTKSANMDSFQKASASRNLFGSDPSASDSIPSIPLLMPPKDIPRQRFPPTESYTEAEPTSTLSSPFHSPKHSQFPEDWPLSTSDSPQRSPDTEPSSHTKKSQSEIYTPAVPIETDAFDQMFVQNFPGATSARPSSAREAREPARWSEGHRRAKSMPRTKGKSPVVVSIPRDRKQPSGLLPDRTPLNHIVLPDPSASRPKSMVAEVSSLLPLESNMPSGPESLDQTLTSLEQSDPNSAIVPNESIQTEMSASLLTQAPAVYGPSSEVEGDQDLEQSNAEVLNDDDRENGGPGPVRRASLTSVGASKRADVKSVDVQGSSKLLGHQSAADSPSHTPEVSRPASPLVVPSEITSSTPASHQSTVVLPTPPRNSSLGKAATTARPETPTSRHRDTLPSSPLDNRRENTPEGRVAPLNAAMTKRRGKVSKRSDHHSPGVLTLSPSKKGAVFNPEGDSFDRHISEVLETLPTSIRFKTRPGAETPVSDAGEPRSYGAPRARTARIQPRHNVTIAPADSPPKRLNATSDNEVKVYHLTQAGSDETIKLFVRLVGESERVMVRVGGGWADLADYLRQYAEHHGSRTVSQGTLEFQPVNGTASRRVSAAAEQKGKQPVTPNTNKTPGNEDPNWLGHGQPRFSMGDGTSSDEGDSVVTTRLTPSAKTTPMSTNGSRPSTSHTERPSSRQSASDLKLSGPPSGKRGLLSEDKEKWVEGMIERAKQASAEKTKEENQKYFAELGKAGATRRVIFRSSSAMSNRPNGGDKGK